MFINWDYSTWPIGRVHYIFDWFMCKDDKHSWYAHETNKEWYLLVDIFCKICWRDATKNVIDSYNKYHYEKAHKEYIRSEAYLLWLFNEN
jgi:hypothetical protein